MDGPEEAQLRGRGRATRAQQRCGAGWRRRRRLAPEVALTERPKRGSLEERIRRSPSRWPAGRRATSAGRPGRSGRPCWSSVATVTLSDGRHVNGRRPRRTGATGAVQPLTGKSCRLETDQPARETVSGRAGELARLSQWLRPHGPGPTPPEHAERPQSRDERSERRSRALDGDGAGVRHRHVTEHRTASRIRAQTATGASDSESRRDVLPASNESGRPEADSSNPP